MKSNFSDLSNLNFGSGEHRFKMPSYYTTIPRLSDMLNIEDIKYGPIDVTPSNFYIGPAQTKYDDMVEDIIYRLNAKLSRPIHITSSSVLDSLEEMLMSDGQSKIELKAKLLKKGKTAVLTKVASKINTTSIAQFARAVLSEEGIFFYLAYRAIEGNDIEDVEGIISDILKSVRVIRAYINVKLVSIIAENERLRVSYSDLKIIRQKLRHQQISFKPGSPTQYIVKVIQDLKNTGNLSSEIMKFLDENEKSFKRRIDKDELAARMLKYLKRIGYKLENTSNLEEISCNLEVINGIGPIFEEQLYKAGITSFQALAKLSKSDLEGIIGTTQNSEDILNQATQITAGDFILNTEDK